MRGVANGGCGEDGREVMNSNENICKNLRHGIYMDGYDIKINKTESIMKEGAARIERQADEIEALTIANQRLRTALEDAINECEFDYLRTRWRLILNENGEK